MNNIWQNYKSSILLLAGIIGGGLIGYLWQPAATCLAPIGKIFINIMFVIIVPMIFFSVSAAVSKLTTQSSLSRTLLTTAIVVIVLMLLYSVLTYLAMLAYPPLGSDHSLPTLQQTYGAQQSPTANMAVDALSVSDFSQLFSTRHILPLIIIAILTGVAAARLRNNKITAALDYCNQLMAEMLNCLMLLAPLGLGCYFADIMSVSAATLVSGYGRATGLYFVIAAIVFFLLNPLCAALSGVGIKDYWRHTMQPSLLSVSTLSSSACIPSNIKACVNLGCSQSVAETIIPLGTQLFKQGSVISCAVKVAFVILITGGSLATWQSLLLVVGVGMLASIIVGAIPTGAGTAELFICSVLGADPQLVAMLIVISTLVDIPGTLLNVNGNTVLTIIINKLTKSDK